MKKLIDGQKRYVKTMEFSEDRFDDKVQEHPRPYRASILKKQTRFQGQVQLNADSLDRSTTLTARPKNVPTRAVQIPTAVASDDTETTSDLSDSADSTEAADEPRLQLEPQNKKTRPTEDRIGRLGQQGQHGQRYSTRYTKKTNDVPETDQQSFATDKFDKFDETFTRQAKTKTKIKTRTKTKAAATEQNDPVFSSSICFVTAIQNSTKNESRKYTYVSNAEMPTSSQKELLQLFRRNRHTFNFDFVVPSATTKGIYTCTVGRDNVCSCRGWTFAQYPKKTCVHLKDIYRALTVGFPKDKETPGVPLCAAFHVSPPLKFSCVGRSIPVYTYSKETQCFSGSYKIRTKIDGIRVAVFPNGLVFTKNLFLYDVSCRVMETFADYIQAKTFPAMDCELYLCNVNRSTHDQVMKDVINRAQGRTNFHEVALAVLDLYVPAFSATATSFSDFQPKDTETMAQQAIVPFGHVLPISLPRTDKKTQRLAADTIDDSRVNSSYETQVKRPLSDRPGHLQLQADSQFHLTEPPVAETGKSRPKKMGAKQKEETEQKVHVSSPDTRYKHLTQKRLEATDKSEPQPQQAEQKKSLELLQTRPRAKTKEPKKQDQECRIEPPAVKQRQRRLSEPKPFANMTFSERFAVLQQFFKNLTSSQANSKKGRYENNKRICSVPKNALNPKKFLHLLDGTTETEKESSQMTVQDLTLSFLKRISQNQEGVVVHNMDSRYYAGKRDIASSFKIKHEQDILELALR